MSDREIFNCEFQGWLVSIGVGPAIGERMTRRVVADVVIESDKQGIGTLKMIIRLPDSDDDFGSLRISQKPDELPFYGESKLLGARR